MHRNKREPPYEPVGEAVGIAVYSTKGVATFFHGTYASRAEADDFARAITLPPHDHDTAVVRQSRAYVADRHHGPTDYSFKPVLATVNGQPTEDFTAAHELESSNEVDLAPSFRNLVAVAESTVRDARQRDDCARHRYRITQRLAPSNRHECTPAGAVAPLRPPAPAG